jgi:hypothetical protein
MKRKKGRERRRKKKKGRERRRKGRESVKKKKIYCLCYIIYKGKLIYFILF